MDKAIELGITKRIIRNRAVRGMMRDPTRPTNPQTLIGSASYRPDAFSARILARH